MKNKYIINIVYLGFLLYTLLFDSGLSDVSYAVTVIYFTCATNTTCCDGACCHSCQNCGVSGCEPKADNSICGTGFKCCSEVCTNILTDSNNCGFCGVTCGGGQSCVSGTCV